MKAAERILAASHLHWRLRRWSRAERCRLGGEQYGQMLVGILGPMDSEVLEAAVGRGAVVISVAINLSAALPSSMVATHAGDVLVCFLLPFPSFSR
jgi:hypothetical protein